MQCTCNPPERDGYPYSQFIGSVFGDCVRTPSEYLSFTCGILSLMLYAVAMFPQLRLNFMRKSVEGLSVYLLIIWATGDLLNLIGTILTNQLQTQVFVAVWFNIVNVLMMCQFVWYSFVYNRNVRIDELVVGEETNPLLDSSDSAEESRAYHSNDSNVRAASSTAVSSSPSLTVTAAAAVTVASSAATGVKAMPVLQQPIFKFSSVSSSLVSVGAATMAISASSASLMPRLCDARPEVGEVGIVLGSVAAWGSGLLYFFSRVPQIRENACNRSVEGLSIGLFVCTLSGNLTYGLSILLRAPPLDWRFVRADLPYVIGSMGVLVFDLIIMGQAVAYGGISWMNL